MSRLKRLLQLTIGLVAAAACLLFVLENQQSVDLSFLGWKSPQLPLALVVILALLAGMAAGPLIGWFIAVRGRRRMRRQRIRDSQSARQV